MKKVIDFLRKIGLLHVSSGDYNTGEFDNKSDLKKDQSTPEMPVGSVAHPDQSESSDNVKRPDQPL